MAKRDTQGKIRPLTVQPQRPTSPSRLPVAVAIALLVIGGSGGYLLGLPSDTTNVATPTPTEAPVAAPAAQGTPVHYNWLEQQPVADDQDVWAVSAAVELEGYLYLLVSDDYESPLAKALWRSLDGEEWDVLELDFGRQVIITDIDVYKGALMLSGWDAGSATVWRSQSLTGDESPVWASAFLPMASPTIGDLVAEASIVTAEVNGADEIVITAKMRVELTQTLLELAGDESVASLLDYQELPEVAVAGSRLWMRIVAADGSESVHTKTIPATIAFTPVAGHYGTEVRPLEAGALWTSADGTVFAGVDLSEVDGVPSPQAFNDIFVSAVAGSTQTNQLWTSPDGAAWTQSSWVPPAECGGWGGLAVGGPGLLLASDTFDTVCLSGDGTDWVVRSSAATTVASTAEVWIEGGPEGYLAWAGNSVEYALLTSSDGFSWNRAESAPDMRGTRTFLVGNRLITTARPVGTMSPRPLVVWVGEPTEE